MKKKLFILILVILIVSGGLLLFTQNASSPGWLNTNLAKKLKGKDQADFDKSRYSIKPGASIWAVVNKKRPLPDGYIPPNLVTPDVKLRLSSGEQQMLVRSDTAGAIARMFGGAKQDGVSLVFGSGYRSEALQRQFYSGYAAKSGTKAADAFSARPGHSEHQTGLAADITTNDRSCHLEICFADTREGKWLANNAYKYGFVIRYLKGKENITGYQYEPWHIRFVGKKLAAELYKSGQTMEEFFGLPAAPNY